MANFPDSNRLFLKEIRLPEVQSQKKGTPDEIEQKDDDEILQRLRRQRFQEHIQELFAPFGSVEEVFVPDRTSKRYAFVRMSTVEAAQAIHRHFQQEPPQPQKHLCQDIRLANDIQPRNKISIKKKSQQQKRIESAQRLAEAANVIVQLQKSHMERLEHYLASNPWQELQIEIVGTLAVKAISFVFCVVKDTGSSDSKDTQKALLDFAQRLETTYYIQQVLQRCLLLPQTGKHGLVLIRESNNMVDTVIGIFQQHCQEPTTASDMTKVRIASYPTNLIAPFLKEMEARWQNLPFDKRIVFEPQQASVTHVLSLIELVPPPATAAAGQGLYVVSLEKVRPILVPSTRPLTTHISTENKDQPQQNGNLSCLLEIARSL